MNGKKPVFGNIGDFLKKFKGYKPSNHRITETVAEALNNSLGTDILKADIKVQGGVVFVRCASIVKQEIVFNKEKLLENINKELPENKIKDIR